MKDGLTGLNNRRSLDKQLEIEWEYARKEKEALSFLLFDIDYFKAYNDTYGHIQGDECLKEVAKIAKSVVFDESVLSQDTEEKSLVYCFLELINMKRSEWQKLLDSKWRTVELSIKLLKCLSVSQSALE